MIRYADNSSRQAVFDMWKTVFGDSPEYMEIYFREKYRNENTLIYFDSGKAVSSLQMLPFRFSFHGRMIPVAYFSGLCTLPEARRKGFMGALIRRAFDELEKRAVPLVMLVPQDEPVMNYYRQFGFVQTFDEGVVLPDLHQLLSGSENLDLAYGEFNSFFRHRDMAIQHSVDHFRAIAEEAALFGYPPKRSLTGMSRVIDAEKLLAIFAAAHPETALTLKVSDSLIERNNAYFQLENGRVSIPEEGAAPKLELDAGELTRLLTGYRIAEMGEEYTLYFPEKEPLIGYMME
ncbi:GNAT family N-acetyltransferase [Petrimonas mucosa]|uniref:N-acetyltransferase domain-containing protein n=1 Tax=Petrimonas mucosa TaxID=1642646 RepID=A0A1G4GBH9_9BACT|nr:GNAT family N-acetyltransferase [Petrimonas mucosa]SCM59855.1 putative protein {ECO:0000313/EMBL:CEA14704,1} [Petrimonas mucosa]SFU59746.1 Sterol carrier protein domain-containing protein [Porphyromonadaceae bacterium KHP3R9]